MTTAQPPLARVLLLCGPSGAGKSRLARRLHARHGWAVVPLDDFYREIGDPALPRSPLGLPDWDDRRSWHADAAVAALEQLCRSGATSVPRYDIASSRVVGRDDLVLAGRPVAVAEGVFAAELIAQLSARGLLLAAWCIRNRPWLTFGRRLVRDLAERRKPPVTLWRRGHVLRRAEPGIVSAAEALGATAMTASEAEGRIQALLREGAASRAGEDTPA